MWSSTWSSSLPTPPWSARPPIRLRGGDPTVGDGFRIAAQHFGTILSYALISATVGMILRWLSERGKGLGRIVSGIAGMAWNLATYLVVPVLVLEDVGPWQAIQRSAALLKKTWGEQIAGNLSVGLIFGLLTIVVILLGIPVFYLLILTRSVALIVLAALLFVLVFYGPGPGQLDAERHLCGRRVSLCRRGRRQRLFQRADGARGLQGQVAPPLPARRS